MGKPIKPIQKAPIEFAGREFSCLKYWQSASAVKVNLSGRRLIFRSPVSINSGSFRASVEAAVKAKNEVVAAENTRTQTSNPTASMMKSKKARTLAGGRFLEGCSA